MSDLIDNKTIRRWEMMYDTFRNEYPDIASRTVDWYPSGRMEITIKTDDGCKYLFDWLNKILRKLNIDREPNDILDEDEWVKEFSINLRRQMDIAKMTQREISEISGIAQSRLSRYINGVNTPSSYTVVKLARALGCSPTELIDI